MGGSLFRDSTRQSHNPPRGAQAEAKFPKCYYCTGRFSTCRVDVKTGDGVVSCYACRN